MTCARVLADPGSDAAQESRARELVNEFQNRLKPELQQAMRDGGPVLAVEVCASKAPRIADALSLDSGWRVKRVSLRARNASRAIPDPWETSVLESFDSRQAGGATAAELKHGEIVNGQYRYMQAQVVEPLCLTCHGPAVNTEVLEVLRNYYPDDRATGYAPGEVRGAFSLVGPAPR
jgi:hypothetical protein